MPSVKVVYMDQGYLILEFDDARLLCVPLVSHPKLRAMSDEDLNNCDISAFGLHWPSFDVDISIDGLLRGCVNCANEEHYPESTENIFRSQ